MSGRSDQTILVVDANPVTRKMVTDTLTGRGHHVLDASDGSSALDLAARHQPVIVLQDLVLPDVDGFALVGELRKQAHGAMAIVAFSGFRSSDDEARISAVGFDDVIVKPISAARLVPIVEAHLCASTAATDPFGTGRRLIVVDDDPIQLKLTRFRLEKLGFTVDAAGDGQAALELARRAPPDAIVSDLLMPKLDGFGLAHAVRRDARLSDVPVLLVTSSYAAGGDRELAQRAGARDLILRTPEHREVTQALHGIFSPPKRGGPTRVDEPAISLAERDPSRDLSDVESAHTRRVIQQLERQVVVNAGLARRSSAMSAELSVLAGISDAVLRNANVEAALDEALGAFLDAGGISAGALYLLDETESLRVRPLGDNPLWSPAGLRGFFGDEALLRRLLAEGRMISLPSADLPAAVTSPILQRAAVSRLVLMPLVHLGQPLGGLLMAPDLEEAEREDWRSFAQAVGNQVAQAIAIARAFAQREAAEVRAREQERVANEQSDLLQLVLDSAPDAITRVDHAGVITFTNHAAPPRTRDQMIGTPWIAHLPPEHRAPMEQALRGVLDKGEATSHEVMSTGAHGRVEWCSHRIGPVRTGRAVIGAIIVSRVTTAEKQREAQLIVSDRMASIGALAAGVAHEINNPLAAIIANLQLVSAGGPTMGHEATVDCLKDALEAAERVQSIARDLKIFSRSEEDKSGSVDVHAVLESTFRLAWNEIRHRAHLKKDFHPVPTIQGNESRLGQVFLNLMINAAQAIPEGAVDRNEIRVTTRLEEDMVAVHVADSGPGIPEDNQRHLFTPFFTTKPRGIGTGLGLSICHRIIAEMKGQIRVDSREGVGTTFTVLLPASPETARVAPPPSPTPVQVRGGRRGQVLIVDDERVVSMAVARALRANHDVVEASNARDALTQLQAGARFDLILCDLMMPQMTGMDLHAALAVLDPAQADRMVFLTGGAFTASARQFLDSVPNLSVEKPFDLWALRALVDERVSAVG